ncbi:hotdog family protein [Effusibacillus dendaii]|uniref:Acyl dehydratase n=1 Tax=Effusibacillus dendaii TaxID=2743772 RepID=A0A7I8D7X8_9BACL|nr:hypothetical protein [Effusibacillus dendaii]BCJ86248.1 hypothetical protein skT53_12330 [Effusibacillus dendaii]
MTARTPTFEQVEVGYQLPPLIRKPTYVKLFRYSAITWNAHRIHYDQNYAKEEGYPDVLVQSHLHGAFLTQLCTDWAGPCGELKSLTVTVKRFAVPGDILTCHGIVVEKKREDGSGIVVVDLQEINQNGEICAPGRAEIKLPYFTLPAL